MKTKTENDFQVLVSSLNKLENGFTYDIVKQDAEKCYIPNKNTDSLFYNPAFPILGFLSDNNEIYSIIHFYPGDDLYPIMRTFDKQGKLIDEQQIVNGGCAGWDCDFDECDEKFKVINQIKIEDVLILVTTPCDTSGNKQPNSTKKEILKKTITVENNGKIKVIEDIG